MSTPPFSAAAKVVGLVYIPAFAAVIILRILMAEPYRAVPIKAILAPYHRGNVSGGDLH
jgi:hypothetical protein